MTFNSTTLYLKILSRPNNKKEQRKSPITNKGLFGTFYKVWLYELIQLIMTLLVVWVQSIYYISLSIKVSLYIKTMYNLVES